MGSTGINFGTITFLIYLNDISNYSLVPKNINFADDTSITACNTNISHLFEVQQNLNLIYKWLVSNKLIPNSNKSICMILTNRVILDGLTLNIRGSTIKKFLFVTNFMQ